MHRITLFANATSFGYTGKKTLKAQKLHSSDSANKKGMLMGPTQERQLEHRETEVPPERTREGKLSII